MSKIKGEKKDEPGSSGHSGSCRGAFAINSYGPQPIDALKPKGNYELWMGLISSDRDGPTITCPRRRGLAAMIREVMTVA